MSGVLALLNGLLALLNGLLTLLNGLGAVLIRGRAVLKPLLLLLWGVLPVFRRRLALLQGPLLPAHAALLRMCMRLTGESEHTTR